MGTGWELTKQLRDKIWQYASYPQTSISIRQMVQFGPSPSPGSIFLASQFIVEELPIRLALKVRDLENSPLGLLKMPSTVKVKNWYAQSFEELTSLPKPKIDEKLYKQLYSSKMGNDHETFQISDKINENLSILPDSSNLAQEQKSNPAVNNVFSDDGIVIRPHLTNSSLSAANTRSRTESPTFGKTYFNPCPTNIIWPKEVYDYNKLVYDALNKIKKRHDATVATMAQGVQEWKTEHQLVQVNSAIQTFLDRFYMLRIGIRMLIGQHIALNMSQALPTRQKISNFLNGSNGDPGQNGGSKSNYVGVICTECNVKEIAEDAIETAKYICEEYYGLFEAPEVQLIAPQELVNFMYVPGHLIHMLFEVLKNSLRATIEFHIPILKQEMLDQNPELKVEEIDLNDLKFPAIKVIISEGYEDIAIKVSDEGGGIARSEIPLIWTYLYTTVDKTPTLDTEFNQTTFKAPMAGFGYGLPISRLYAQYFGGDLKLISMEGYGTDVYIHLNRLSSSLEPLP